MVKTQPLVRIYFVSTLRLRDKNLVAAVGGRHPTLPQLVSYPEYKKR